MRTLVIFFSLCLIIRFGSPANTFNTTEPGLWETFQNNDGGFVNREALLEAYSAVCPIHIHREGSHQDPPQFINSFGDLLNCGLCTFDIECVQSASCCPGEAHSYLKYECVDVIVYANDMTPDEYLMVTSCPETGSQTLKNKCEAIEEYRDSDPQISVPVTSSITEVTYRNKYCAVCNGEEEFRLWELNVHCNDSFDVTSYRSMSEVKRAIKTKGCRVLYTTDPSTYMMRVSCKNLHTPSYKINKCNITGLWENYDPDIKWACENLNNPFQDFSNVFCFLCNPSFGSTLQTELISECNVTGQWMAHDSAYDPDLEDACLSQPRNERFGPYKNVYCLLCNNVNLYSQSFKIEEKDILLSSSTVRYGHGKTDWPLNITIKASNDSISDVLRLISENLEDNPHSLHYKTTEGSEDIQNMDFNVSSLLSQYSWICGRESLCETEQNDTQLIRSIFYPCGTCLCNTTCVHGSSCCLDELMVTMPFSCLQLVDDSPKLPISSRDFIVVDKCIDDAISQPVKQKCEGNPNGQSDFLSLLPVKGQGRLPYKNVHCWNCSGSEQLMEISMMATCSSLFEAPLYSKVSKFLVDVLSNCHIKFILPEASPSCIGQISDQLESVYRHFNYYTYVSACNQTGTWFEYDRDVELACERSFTLSQLKEISIGSVIYRNVFCFICNPYDHDLPFATGNDVISTCNETGLWDDDTEIIIRACAEYPMYSRFKPFKNLFCFLCNVPQSYLSSYNIAMPIWTDKLYIFTNLDRAVERTSGYRKIFSLDPSAWSTGAEEEEPQPECEGGTYDVQLGSCRQLFCSEGRVLTNGSCIPVVDNAVDLLYKLTFYFRVSNMSIGLSNWFNLDGVCNSIIDFILASSSKATYTANIETKSCLVAVNTPCIFSRASSIPGVLVMENQFISVNMELWASTSSRHAIEEDLVGALSESYMVKTFRKSEIILEHTDNFPNQDSHKFDPNNTCYYGAMRHRMIMNWETLVEPTLIVINQLLVCPRVRLTESEYTFNNDTGDIELVLQEKTLKIGDFIPSDNMSILICEDVILENSKESKGSSREITTIEIIHKYYSDICTVVSLVCLLATFITYCIFPALRTLPGKNNMALVVTLFCAQAALQFGLVVDNQTVCLVLGLFIHFFWVATFCAMNICSFHMFRVFRSMSLPSSDENRKLLIKYIVYICLLPFCLVAVNVTVAMVTSGAKDSGYGAEFCFISRYMMVVVTFIIPASVIFLTNIIFFGVTFYKIRTSPTVEHSGGDKRELALYAKLCTVTGVAWPLQIVDATLPVTVFSFFVTFINALQGLFIFVSYVCNRRVSKLYKKSFQSAIEGRPWTFTSRQSTSTNMTDLKVSNSN